MQIYLGEMDYGLTGVKQITSILQLWVTIQLNLSSVISSSHQPPGMGVNQANSTRHLGLVLCFFYFSGSELLSPPNAFDVAQVGIPGFTSGPPAHWFHLCCYNRLKPSKEKYYLTLNVTIISILQRRNMCKLKKSWVI